ncbi:MAG TPA: ABC transporter ATP-binding protein [Paracoccaceae bacterium]|nr:ABC transporter ATP-binding protein [Paracoccaceae bacterium]
MSLIRTEALSRHFGGVKAVDGVDFKLAAGETRAIIGPNGAGKSTFVGLLCGRVQPSSGRIFWEGRDITTMPAHKRVRLGIGYTFQITSIFPGLTLAENVALAVQRRGVADLDGEVQAVLAQMGLSAQAEATAGEQSYGHQRLLEIAMGLALRPRLLILDEPTQGLAVDEIARFIGLMREIATETTLLLIEHNMDVVMALAERITVLEAGRVLAEGSPAEIRANAAVQAAYLGA